MTETPETPGEKGTIDRPNPNAKNQGSATGRRSGQARDTKPATKRRGVGTWLTFTAGDMGTVGPHSSEINALREAVDGGKRRVFVEFGQTIDEALEAADLPQAGA